MEASTQQTGLSLELEPGRSSDANTRQQLTEICVTQLGLSPSDAQRLLNSSGPFTVSAWHGPVELDYAISQLRALGVLVRTSPTHPKSGRSAVSIDARMRRSSLYSSEYRELLGASRIITQPGAVPAKQPPSSHSRARKIVACIGVLLLPLAISSFRYTTNLSHDAQWAIHDGDTKSALPARVSLQEESTASFHGASSTSGIQISAHVIRNGDNYSVRFSGDIADPLTPRGRIEGEPVFLKEADGKLSATTPSSIRDASGTVTSRIAHIQVERDTKGDPQRAHIAIELTDPMREQDPERRTPIDMSVELLAR